MPSKVKVRVLAGRNLPVMDRANDSTDAFVEIRLGSVVQKTDVCRRSLNPQWNSDWFRFEVQDDADLQDEPLQLRVMDHDTYSAHDAIGKVYLSLSPLLVSEWSEDAATMVSGWMPVYDTLHGIRGEINVMVKVDLFTDFNKFKQSSCGVQFFSCSGVPSGCHVQALLGFVEHLVVNDDPEYQWIDKIRTPRASNEARQTLFCKLSGQVQRRVGMATIEAGGNAVIGYQQWFDLEGESGIVVRAIGTAVSICQHVPAPVSHLCLAVTGSPSQRVVDQGYEASLQEPPASPRPFSVSGSRSGRSDTGRQGGGGGVLSAAQSLMRRGLSWGRRRQEAGYSGLTTAAGLPERAAVVALSRQSYYGPLDSALSYSPVSRGPSTVVSCDSTSVAGSVAYITSAEDEGDEQCVGAARAVRRSQSSSLDGWLCGSTDLTRSLPPLGHCVSLDSVECDRVPVRGGAVCRPPAVPHDSAPLISLTAPAVGSDGFLCGAVDGETAEEQLQQQHGSLGQLNASTFQLAVQGLQQHDTVYISSANVMVEVAAFYSSDDRQSPLASEAFCGQQKQPLSRGPAAAVGCDSQESVARPLLAFHSCPDWDRTSASADSTMTSTCDPTMTSTCDGQTVGTLSPDNSDIDIINELPVSAAVAPKIPDDDLRSERPQDSDTPGVACLSAAAHRAIPAGPTTDSDSGESDISPCPGSTANSSSNSLTPSVPVTVRVRPATAAPAGTPGVSLNTDAATAANGAVMPDDVCTEASGSADLLASAARSCSITGRLQQQQRFESSELPFLTMRSYPAGFITHIGGTVTSRSVKLLDHVEHPEEGESRSAWWAELRTEIKSHCRALACSAVLGYEERTSFCEEVCVLSASGTAAVVNFCALGLLQPSTPAAVATSGAPGESSSYHTQDGCLLDESNVSVIGCGLCHIPYNESSLPLPSTVSTCNVCKLGRVPDVIFCTFEPSEYLATVGRGCLIQAQVCREKTDLKSEALAKEISDRLPFIEYDLHRQLINKLRMIGMNALFDLNIQLSFGEELIVAMATATAVYLAALPAPVDPCVVSGSAIWTDTEHLEEAQKKVANIVDANRRLFLLPLRSALQDNSDSAVGQDTAAPARPDVDLSNGNKETCVLEIDDGEDLDTLCGLLDWRQPAILELVTSRCVPGAAADQLLEDRQLFTRCLRTKLSSVTNLALGQLMDKLIQSLYFKMRKLTPCALCGLRFSIDVPESDEVQISVYGNVISLASAITADNCRSWMTSSSSADVSRHPAPATASATAPANASGTAPVTAPANAPATAGSLAALKLSDQRWHNGLDVIITPLDCVTGAKVDRHLGYLNCFFIRECASLREVGGLNGFVQSLMTEVLAVIRAHVTCLGGNALLSYFMSHCVLLHNPNKNQAQCLVNLGGDVVRAGYIVSSLTQ